MSKPDGGSAFPLQEQLQQSGEQTWLSPLQTGMTLRDYFAAQVLAGMHARDGYDPGQKTPEMRAALCYLDADAMLAERDK